MRSLLSCAALVMTVFLVSTASAQTGTICLYADPQGTQCNISDTAPGLLSVYVIHSPLGTPQGGAVGAQFSAPKPDCMVGATWIVDESPFASAIGSSQTGVAIGYGRCIADPTHVLTVKYMVSGSSGTDCAYEVVRDPVLNIIEVVTCEFEEIQGAGGVTYVNSALPCECSEPAGPPVLSVSSSSIDFGTTATRREITIWNGGGGVLTWSIAESAPWLTVKPVSGTGFKYVGLTASRSGLPLGAYETDLAISSNGGIFPVHVSMEVAQVLTVSPTRLTFESTTVELILQVTNMGPEPVSWTVAWDRPWLGASPAQGVDNKDVRVRVNRSGLADGTYTGTVTVAGGNDVIQVPVTMKVASNQGPGGTIGVFSDPQASGCNFFDQTTGLMTVYIVHVLTAGATASQFAAPMPSCMTGATYLGDSSPFLVVIGSSQTGVSVGYGSCLSGPIHVLSVQYFVLGLSQTCCVYPVVPDPSSMWGTIDVVDCSFRYTRGAGAHAIVNPDATCQCGSIKTEEATWGKIKSMYSE